ncbi:MAG: hypothetical protein RLZZ616_1465 [Pseudomonadota bacterium]|jgi:hypothetical protein
MLNKASYKLPTTILGPFVLSKQVAALTYGEPGVMPVSQGVNPGKTPLIPLPDEDDPAAGSGPDNQRTPPQMCELLRVKSDNGHNETLVTG